ncbi:MAG: hypothetical protein R2873_31400 [Caldilineaceae bacterium]
MDTLEAKSTARPLELDGQRQEIEKNWMLFEHEGDLFAVYRIAPHTILQLDLAGSGSVHCGRRYETAWDVSIYADRYGVPCGGAPPVRRGEQYVSFFHSRIQVGALRHLLPLWPKGWLARLPRYPAAILRRVYWQLDQRYYYGGAYTFAATPPFEPIAIHQEPLLRPEWERPYSGRRRSNQTARAVVYPCGAIDESPDRWLLSYGLHDEACCLRRFSQSEVTS